MGRRSPTKPVSVSIRPACGHQLELFSLSALGRTARPSGSATSDSCDWLNVKFQSLPHSNSVPHEATGVFGGGQPARLSRLCRDVANRPSMQGDPQPASRYGFDCSRDQGLVTFGRTGDTHVFGERIDEYPHLGREAAVAGIERMDLDRSGDHIRQYANEMPAGDRRAHEIIR